MSLSLQYPNNYFKDRSRGIRFKLEKNFLNKITRYNYAVLFPELEKLLKNKLHQKNSGLFAEKINDLKNQLNNKVLLEAERHFKDILKVNLSENFEGSWFKVPDRAVTSAYDSLLMQTKYKRNVETLINRAFGSLTNKYYEIDEQRLSKDITNEIMSSLENILNKNVIKIQRLTYTNTTRAVNRGREIQYRERDPTNQFRYVWQTVPDKRRTPQCAQIVLRVESEMKRTNENGVTLSRLKMIVDEIANLPTFKKSNPNIDWVPHWNCRSTIRKVVE